LLGEEAKQILNSSWKSGVVRHVSVGKASRMWMLEAVPFGVVRVKVVLKVAYIIPPPIISCLAISFFNSSTFWRLETQESFGGDWSVY
jgi:hypothetical protein